MVNFAPICVGVVRGVATWHGHMLLHDMVVMYDHFVNSSYGAQIPGSCPPNLLCTMPRTSCIIINNGSRASKAEHKYCTHDGNLSYPLDIRGRSRIYFRGGGGSCYPQEGQKGRPTINLY